MSTKANTARLKKITDKARSIRKSGETWISAVKRAAKMIPSLSPSKKAAKKKSAKVGKRKPSKSRQTGTSSLLRDRRLTAKAPGKRIVRHKGKKSTKYYERRKNRSDKPGKLTGAGSGASIYRTNVMNRVTSTVRQLNEAEQRLRGLQQLLKAVPASEKADKKKIRGYITDQKKYISTLKADIRGFKSLIK